MKSVRLIPKYGFYALVFSFLQFGCSSNVGKFNMHQEEEQLFNSNSQENIDIADHNSKEKDPCNICFEQNTNDDCCINLQCSPTSNITHNFHKSCIHEWVKRNRSCPTCRTTIPQEVINDIKRSPLFNLFKAIDDEDVNQVQLFVQNNPSLVGESYDFSYMVDQFTRRSGSWTSLAYAIKRNRVPIFKVLLQTKNIDVNKLLPSCLCCAAAQGNMEIFKMLLEVDGIDVNKQDNNGYTPLHWAANNGHTKIVKMLLEADGIDVNKADISEDTPLHCAARNGHTEIVEMLLKVTGIDLNKRNKSKNTPLHLAVNNGHTKIVKMLLDVSGVDVNEDKYPECEDAVLNRLIDGGLIIITAIDRGHIDTVDMLLEVDGIDVNKADIFRGTPLHHAVIATVSCIACVGHPEIVKMLLEVDGIDVNKQDNQGMTPLHHAASVSCIAYVGHIEIVKMLLEVDRIDVNKQDKNGYTPLHWAAKNGHTEIVEMLLKVTDIDVNKRDKNKNTPLHLAASYGHTEIVTMFKSFQAAKMCIIL